MTKLTEIMNLLIKQNNSNNIYLNKNLLMKLTVKKRTVFWKSVKLMRKDFLVPWIVYSKHLNKPIKIQFDKNEFLKVYSEAWESTPIKLEGDWVNKLVLIHDHQVHPVTNLLLHVDFLAVKSDEKVKADIPIIIVWESDIEKKKLWKIELVKDHVLVEALPSDLPHNIKVDVSNIVSSKDVIFLKELDLWEKVQIKDNLDLPIITVVELSEELDEENTEEDITAESNESK